MLSHAESIQFIKQNISLTLECIKIPKSVEQLCYIANTNKTGPFDDIVIYHMNSDQQILLLGIQRGGVTTFGGFGFSTNGKYMWQSWAEEGHPNFEFFNTKDYLENYKNVNSLAFFDDYYFSHFEKFNDSGIVTYSLVEGFTPDNHNHDDFMTLSESVFPSTPTKLYYKNFNLKEENNSNITRP